MHAASMHARGGAMGHLANCWLSNWG